jgi:hypothetical protein
MYKYHRFHLLQYSWFSMLLFFGILILSVSCDIEDDMPPPSAYEEPDPSEECEFKIVVPVLADGLDFECGVPQTESFGEKDGTITIESSDNPAKEGINTSEKVMKVEQSAGVEGWAGFFFNLAEKIDFSEKRTIKIKVYSPAAGEQVNLKLEDAVDGAISTEVIAETTVANEWEELSFSFSSRDSDKYQKMVLFFNFNGNKDAATVHYFDDIVLVEGGGAEEPEGPSSVPAVAAQAPTLDESLVISLFSDAYDNVTVDTWRTEWSDAVLTDTLIAGDAVKKYSQLNFVGIEAVSSPIDATSMTHFHVDVWTADATEIKIKLVDFGADGAFDGGDDVEHEIVIENPTQEEWVSLNIPLSNFTGLTTQAHIAQLIFVGAPTKGNTIFIDNIYFYDGSGSAPATAAPAPTQAQADVISIYSDAYTNIEGVDTNPFWGQNTVVTTETVEGDNVLLLSGLNYQGIDFHLNMQDVSSKTMVHLDVWSVESVTFNFSLISDGPNEVPVVVTSDAGAWKSIDIPLSDFISQVDLTKIIQFKFDDGGSGSAPTFYIDNLYFY